MRKADVQRAQNPWVALALTVLAPFVVLLLGRVSLPGVDTTTLHSKDSFSVVALGIMPLITAAYVVEIAALIVPSWRSLRHGGPEGRSKLGRAAVFLAYALAVFQGFGVATMLESFSVTPGIATRLTLLLTLVAGVACIHLLAETVSKRGLASGYGLLFATSPMIALFQGLGEPKAQTSAGSILGLLAAIAAVAGVTWYTLERSEPTQAPTHKTGTYREAGAREQAPPLRLPAPASGTVPITLAISLLALPASVAAFSPGAQGLADLLQNNTVFNASTIVLVVIAALLFTRLFNLPERVAKVFNRARGKRASYYELEDEAHEALRPATARAILFLLALLVIEQLAHKISPFPFVAAWTALTVALVLDIAAELRARLAVPDLVPVWPEHRPYAIAAAREVLNEAGIPVHARGERLRRLLQFFGPYVPIELMVPRKHAEDASSILREILLETGKTEEENLDALPPLPAVNVPRKARPGEAIRALVVGGILLIILIWSGLSPNKQTPPPPPARDVTLEFMAVDDSTGSWRARP